jgi:polyisoprenoid-binding protein YceI
VVIHVGKAGLFGFAGHDHVVAGAYDLDVTGQLSLHGVTRSVSLPLRVETRGDTLTASGRVVLRQTDYAMTPVSVAGVVKVKDELRIDYVVVAARVTP